MTSRGCPLPGWLARIIESPVTRGLVVTVALAFTAWITFAAFFGQNLVVNPVFGTVYAVLWVGLVPAALLFGPIYRLCNPLRWIHRGLCLLLRRDPAQGLIDYPDWLGMWPAALGLYAFTWLELVNPDYSTSLPVVRAWFLGLAVILLAIGVRPSVTRRSRWPTRSRCTRPWSPGCRRSAAVPTACW